MHLVLSSHSLKMGPVGSQANGTKGKRQHFRLLHYTLSLIPSKYGSTGFHMQPVLLVPRVYMNIYIYICIYVCVCVGVCVCV